MQSDKCKGRSIRKRILTLLCAGAVLLPTVSALLFALAWYLCPFPMARLQQWPASPLVLDAKGRPLFGVVGRDEQWRYPVPLSDVSPWLVQATIAAEDQRFYCHPGVDPRALVRALGQNLRAGQIVSGASTLDMQLCRMMDDRTRTLRAKIIETFRALQLDRLMGKDEILEMYLNIAPYGGNLRGAEAASRKYFGKRAGDLSLAEAALIAGLPQSPSRYYPDRHVEAALKRQQVVLRSMFQNGMITAQQLEEAQSSPVPICGSPRARYATHVCNLALSRRPAGGQTTIDLDIQQQVEKLARKHVEGLPDNTEVAVVVLDVTESAIVALLGSGDPGDPVDGQVNGVLARRSPGSALKPFIYAAAFEAGRLNGQSTVYDVPITRGAWSPSNFDKTYAQEITAAEALRRSLNVPAILVAEGIGLARCCGILEAVGVSLPPDAQRRGGLALAVGGVEVTLLDLTNAYATLARRGIRRRPRLFTDEPVVAKGPSPVLKPRVCAAISEILSSRHRQPASTEDSPAGEIPWFMWKTGTSSGRRDAWAVGHNYRYAVGVWVGRFRGTGRAQYIGAQAAEPLLAELFCLSRIRNDVDPAPPEAIETCGPPLLPREVAKSLQITAPGAGEVFIATAGTAIVHARANQDQGNSWFLNGRLEGGGQARRLVLTPGVYELRCVSEQGSSSLAKFTVCPPDNQIGNAARSAAEPAPNFVVQPADSM
jgi:penicillin-binding protein 1C